MYANVFEKSHSMVWYAMLCYPMLWHGMESMVCYEILMLCYEISMLCYAMVYAVKDKHSATVLCTGHLFVMVISEDT